MKKRILITGVHIGLGGIESVLVNFLSSIDYHKYDVDLVLYKNIGTNLKKLPKKVHVYSPFSYKKLVIIDKLTKKDNFLNKVVRKLFFNKHTYKCYLSNKQYDIGISFAGYHYLMDLFVGFSHCTKKYIWVHTDMEYLYNNDENFKTNFLNTVTKYQKFDKIIAVSKSAMQTFINIYPESKNKIDYIWNIMPTEISKEKIKFDKNIYNIVSVGRLELQKGYERLIDVASLLSKSKKKFHIYILGSGSQKEILLNKLEEKQMTNYISFLGAQENVYKYLNAADLFLSTSYYEGFCTAIIESLLCGVPVVAPKVTGIVDIANDLAPKNSFILTDDNIKAMAKGVEEAMAGKVNKLFKFDTKKINQKIIDKYNKLLAGKI